MKNTTLCYIENDNDDYLMLYRNKKKNDPNAGKWIGIGGKFKEGESPEECLLREVYEETGLTLLEWKLRGIVTFVSNEWETEYMFLYTANNWSGELTDCNEGSLAWKHKSEFNNLPMWEGDKIFLKLLREQNDFFSLKLSYEYQRLIQVVLNGKNIDL
ncbi:MAG: 8-oxo-dGTP diphosphatase [Spirochaetales bacterium]|nr:8-oxo-dGTP diphosphatase [Spirochaetales bacterium]MBR2317453.1 8-oxo-dGTP diphosphatase [Spirochaetales bacterium]